MEDVDADGASDSDVSVCLTGGNLGWMHYLYLSNRGCTKAAGTFGGGEFSVLDSKSHGVKDIEYRTSGGCAGHDFSWTRLSWNGRAYRVADTADCYFCDDELRGGPPPRGANRHWYCKKEQAMRKREGL